MARDYFVNGETMVSVKGMAGTAIAALTQLGLADSPIRIRPTSQHLDIDVDAWGRGVPEQQYLLGDVIISMNLVHIDRDVLDVCIRESAGGGNGVAAGPGVLPRAGARMGNNVAFGIAGNHYIRLHLYSPVGNKPWRFYHTYLANNPFEMPLGVERSVIPLTWRCVPYTVDPWNGGAGAAGTILWDHAAVTSW